MKTTKRVLAILLTVFLLCTSLPFVFAEDDVTIVYSSDDVLVTLDSEGTLILKVLGTIEEPLYGKGLYESLEELNVDTTTIKRLIIGGNITSIGIGFDCFESLESVVLQGNLTDIGDDAFAYCYSLRSVEIPEGVTSIGSRAFYECNALESIVIPEGLISINPSAFGECHSLESIVIPESVMSIDSRAFMGCGIKTIAIPENVCFIGNDAFRNCYLLNAIEVDERNQNYSSIDGVLFNKDQSILIKYPEAKKGDAYSIPGQTKRIEESAFSGNDYIKEITIPETVESLGGYIFSNCVRLEKVSILNPTCRFDVFGGNLVPANTVLYGYENSTTEIQALASNRKFVAITDEAPPEETTTQPATEPTSEPTSEPTTEPTTEPATEPAGQPAEDNPAQQNVFQRIAQWFRNLFDRIFGIFRR